MVNISTNTIILEWLRGEYDSVRFSDALKKILTNHAVSDALFLKPDLNNESENQLRKRILLEYRSYLDSQLFSPQTIWRLEQWSVTDILDEVHYMDYSYWNEISNNTSQPREAAKTILQNIQIFDVDNQPFINAAEAWANGLDFPPIIAFKGESGLTLIEGHLRITALATAERRGFIPDNRKVSIVYGLIPP